MLGHNPILFNVIVSKFVNHANYIFLNENTLFNYIGWLIKSERATVVHHYTLPLPTCELHRPVNEKLQCKYQCDIGFIVDSDNLLCMATSVMQVEITWCK